MTQLRDLILANAENYSLNDYGAIAAWFNHTPFVNNPAAQQNVSKPVASQYELFAIALLDPATQAQNQAALEKIAGTIQIGNTLSGHTGISNAGNLPGLVDLAETFGMASATVQALRDRLAETIPDPNYQPQIPGEPRWQTLGLSAHVTNTAVQDALVGYVEGVE
jgi:hypothetical protein